MLIPDPYRFYAPAEALRTPVRILMAGQFADEHHHLPATLAGYLSIYLKGHATLLPPDGPPQPLPPAFVCGAALQPTFFRVEPGSAYLLANLRVQHLPSLLGAAPADLAGKYVPLEDILDSGSVASLLARVRSAPDTDEAIAILQDFLIAGLRPAETPLPVREVREADLARTVDELAEEAGLSLRQYERRFVQQYGIAPRDYRRLGRFNAALAGLMMQPPGKGELARVAQDFGYFDAAHFARDFNAFIGAPPGKFMNVQGQDGSVYSSWRFTPEEMRYFLD